jgi:hypothetical protein
VVVEQISIGAELSEGAKINEVVAPINDPS